MGGFVASADHGAAVLVVEDEPLVRAMAADIFMDAGYRVFEARDANEALMILEGRDDVGAVFTDIEMPGTMNGIALATTIRTRWPKVAVLITSGRVLPAQGMLPSGAAFIPKPYRPSELIHLVETIGFPIDGRPCPSPDETQQ